MMTVKSEIDYQVEISNLKQDVATANEERRNLEESVQRYRSDIEKMDMEIERIGIQHQEEVKALNAQIAELTKDLTTSLNMNQELVATVEDYQKTFRMIIEVIERTSSTRYDESFPYAALVRSLADTPLNNSRKALEPPF